MRNIINLSLPQELAGIVRREVRRGKFASTSEFFRHLLRIHAFAGELARRRRVVERSGGKRLGSLRELR